MEVLQKESNLGYAGHCSVLKGIADDASVMNICGRGRCGCWRRRQWQWSVHPVETIA
jgi:hypothetical protein